MYSRLISPFTRTSLLTLSLCWISACTEPPAGEQTTIEPDSLSASRTTPESESLSAQRMAQWSRNCALCHVRGEGGAPVLGDREAWAERWAQGESVLLEHTVAGLNNMPPLGYCMDCEEADLRALIRFMGGER